MWRLTSTISSIRSPGAGQLPTSSVSGLASGSSAEKVSIGDKVSISWRKVGREGRVDRVTSQSSPVVLLLHHKRKWTSLFFNSLVRRGGNSIRIALVYTWYFISRCDAKTEQQTSPGRLVGCYYCWSADRVRYVSVQQVRPGSHILHLHRSSLCYSS